MEMYAGLTAPMSSFNIPMRLSRAVDTPFWIRTDRRATKLLNGQLAIKIANPAKAERPSILIDTCTEVSENSRLMREERDALIEEDASEGDLERYWDREVRTKRN